MSKQIYAARSQKWWQPRRSLLTAFLTVLLVSAVGVVLTFRSRGQSLPSVTTSTTAVKSGNASVTQFVIEGYSNGAPSTGTQPQKTNTKTTPSAPSCTKAISQNLSPIDLSGADPGLNKQVDSPSYYQVYGYTVDQVKEEARKCHPDSTEGGDAYFANTAYIINWRFDGTVIDTHCEAGNIKVGVRVRETLPTWTSTSQATAGLAVTWETFSKNLLAHENGHRDLAIQHATILLGELQGITADNCDQLADKATATAQQRLANLNQANGQYDTETHHGASQGAVLR